MPSGSTLYLDHAATTPVRPEVAEAIAHAQASAWANPSSPHAAGRQAKRLLEDARERMLALLGGRATGTARDRLVFTSGATEANRLAILGLAGTSRGNIALSAREHAGVTAAADELAARGWQLLRMPLDGSGRIDPAWSWPATAASPQVLACTLVCGQTGTTFDPTPVAGGTSTAPLVHADATQAILCDHGPFAARGVATLALAPHKFEGPRGIGALLIRHDVHLAAVVPGTQEGGLRGGTEAVPLAVGFARALELAVAERQAVAARIAALRDRFEAAILAAARDTGRVGIVLGAGADRAPHVTTVAFPGFDRQAFVMAADLAGVCCATGTACASGSSVPAPAIQAMRLPAPVAEAAVRFSFGRTTTEADVDAAVARLRGVLAGRPDRSR